jgi:hypothetical protein
MAEIRVERTPKRGLGWLWALLLVLLLAAVAWYLWSTGTFGTRPATTPDSTRVGLETGPSITPGAHVAIEWQPSLAA